MSDKTANKIIAPVRTFAGDLDEVRAKDGHTTQIKKPLLAVSEARFPIPTKNLAVKNTGILEVTKTAEITTIPTVPKVPFHKFKQIDPVKKVEPENQINVPVASKLQSEPLIPFTSEPSSRATVTKIETGPLTVASANKEANPAVIITDTKRNRFSLSRAITEAIANWFEQIKKKAIERKKPKYTIPQADIRKGVIQKATAKTARTNTSDHEEVVNRIKAIKEITLQEKITEEARIANENLLAQNLQSGLLIDHRIKLPRIELRHQTTPTLPVSETENPKFADESETVIEESVIFKEPKVISTQVISTPKIVPKVPQINLIDESKIKPISSLTNSVEPTIVRPIPSTPIVPIAKSFPKILPNIYAHVPRAEKEITPVLAAESLPEQADGKTIGSANSGLETKSSPRAQSRFNLDLLRSNIVNNTNRLTLIGGGIICAIIFSGLVLWPIYRNHSTGVTNLSDSKNTAPVSPLSTSFYVFDKNTILQTVKDTSSSETSFVILNITNKNTGLPITDNSLLSLIDAKVLIDFKESITKSAIGGYRGEPWISLSVTDMSTGFGGMLNWEKTISSDLSPWFGPSIILNKPGALTNFIDQVIDKTDVRVLKDNNGTEKIVYGFVNQNHILITTNSTAFLNILHTLNNQ